MKSGDFSYLRTRQIKMDHPLGRHPKIGGAQGLLGAFDSLYVMVNSNKGASGLYRVRSSKNDDVSDDGDTMHVMTDMLNRQPTDARLISYDSLVVAIYFSSSSRRR
jgi:hypothetical protein